MSKKPIMPTTKTGRWGFWLIIVSAALVALSVATAFVANVTMANQGMTNQAFNLLGVLGPLFVATTLAALIVSWLAIFRFKERSVLLIIFVSVLTLITVLMVTGEIIEGISMSNRNEGAAQ